MSLIPKIQDKLHQSGPWGVVSSALRSVASRIDSKSIGNSSDRADSQLIKKDGITQTSEFLMWTRFAVPGMLCEGNIDAMEYAVANLPSDDPILEIGSFCGLSTVVLAYLLDKQSLSNTIFTCDKWEFEGQQLGALLGDSPSITHDIYQDYVKGTFLRSVKTFAPNRLPQTIECFSDEFFQRWFGEEKVIDVFERHTTLGGKVSFCFIDGNHTYEFAKRDFENADRALVPGGFILFDDSADGSQWEVNQLAREIASGDRYDVVLRNPNYLVRKK